MIERIGRGREPLRIREGGTEADNAALARRNLAVPGLADDQTFTGNNVFTKSLSATVRVLTPATVSEMDLTLTGTDLVKLQSGSGFKASLDMTGLTADRGFSFPDFTGALGIFALTALTLAYVAKAANYTLTESDGVVNATSGTWTATLPTAVGATGKLYVIKNSGAGVITLATTGGQTIDGAAPGTVTAGTAVRLVSTGANWITV